MAKVFSIFNSDRNDHSKVVKQLLSNQPPHISKTKSHPHRPSSGNAHNAAKHSLSKNRGNRVTATNPEKDQTNKSSREDLILEVQELKKKSRALEESNSQLKVENQRLESEGMRQQRRIDQLLNLSEGAKNIGLSAEIRRDIEKSILVRQLKNQINNLRNEVAEKEMEMDGLRRSMKATHMLDLQNERDEYYVEIQRLKGALFELKEELVRERQRREWNNRLAGDTSDDLRKEVARLSSGYQSMLRDISNRSAQGHKPAGTRPVSATASSSGSGAPVAAAVSSAGDRLKRPHSASSTKKPLAAADSRTGIEGTSTAGTSLVNYFESHRGGGAPTTTATAVDDDGMMMSPMGADPLDNFGLVEDDARASRPAQAVSDHAAINIDAVEAVAAVAAALEARGGESGFVGGGGGGGGGIFKVGDRVQGLFQGGGEWYDGEVVGYNATSDQYTILYDDGDKEPHVPLSRLRDPVVAKEAAAREAASVAHAAAPAVIPSIAAEPASHPALVASSTAAANTGGASSMHLHPSMGAVSSAVQVGSSSPFAVGNAADTITKYKTGDKIEALYYNGTTWYAGKVAAVHPAASNSAGSAAVYDITYDDGDRELKVSEANVRFLGAVQAAAATEPVAPPSSTAAQAPAPVAGVGTKQPLFKRDDRVQARYAGGEAWYNAVVVSVTTCTPAAAAAKPSSGGHSTYELLYDDGDREEAALEEHIKLVASAVESSGVATVAPIAQVQVLTTGKIVEDSAAAAAAAAAVPEPKFSEGDRVQGYFEELGTWYDGHIHRVNRTDRTYFVKYDDGDEESIVPESRLRSSPPADDNDDNDDDNDGAAAGTAAATVPAFEDRNKGSAAAGSGSGSSSSSSHLVVHARVEGRYGGGGTWYPATVVSIDTAGATISYELLYDDGDRETDVDASYIRLLDPPSAAAAPAVAPAAVAPSSTGNTDKTAAAPPVNTNLDSFLNDLSDDDEDGASTGALIGALDAGNAVTLKTGDASAPLPEPTPADEEEEDNYDEDFDA
mmetsp:Transcript_3202/g.5403  ORF Transcript_3202/g.5403 Transcript_3202/m.5403 type:complete len:1013 (-) Transcript_3202:68-3106(-)